MLRYRVRCCQGDDRPDCPILETLASNGPDAVQGQRNGAELLRGSAL